MRYIFLSLFFLSANIAVGQTDSEILEKEMTPFEKDDNTTATYHEAIDFYKNLSSLPNVQMNAVGSTDSGHPLHEVVITNDGVFDKDLIKSNGKVVLLINNAIHAGEPCGVDACMMMARDLLSTKSNLLEHAVVVIIPIYNIGGSLNRGSHSRANQNGPKSHGFRGNAKNLDLNRDFIKSDSKNARAFASIFNKWQPQIFIDNHTSNGADYQYTMTLIPTQKDKLHPALSAFMTDDMLPELYKKMKRKSYEMTPYVYSMKRTPDGGIMGFMDLARYSSGYAALHHAISFMPETHMLKPFNDRVLSTYAFTESMLEYIGLQHENILRNQQKAFDSSMQQIQYNLTYELDKSRVEKVNFKGYMAKYKTSDIHGGERLYYDQKSPYNKPIDLYNTYKPTLEISKPDAYIIPQAYSDVIDLLLLNNVKVERLDIDKKKTVDAYYIEDYSSYSRPYEGHYLHHSVEVRTKNTEVQYYKGDYIVYTDQPENRFIVEVLEPQGPDSYFAWNFFDGILMQKEHYSGYVWEDLAAELLKNDAELHEVFTAKVDQDTTFASDGKAQLDFIYKHSAYYEPTYMRYPVARFFK